MSDLDRKILILDNLHKQHYVKNLLNFKENFIINKDFITMIEKLFEIEEYVDKCKPDDVSFWSENQEKKEQHKIWELIKDDFKFALREIVKDFNDK